MSEPTPFHFGGDEIKPGHSKICELPVARIPTDPWTWLTLRAMVVHGARPGRCLWVSAAVHGDELNGVEIIRRLLQDLPAPALAGTVIAVPFVNIFGALGGSRYLPDRRDLNRSFPGSAKGSLAARLAHIVTSEIVARCDFGIDLHTAADARRNLPQLRADLGDPETRRCAQAFAAPVMLDSQAPAGSLRGVATRRGIHTLLYEGGETQRFEEEVIATGEAGIRRVLAALGMLRVPGVPPAAPSRELHRGHWLRARRSGLFQASTCLGARVAKGEVLGMINDPFGVAGLPVRAREDSVVIGLTVNPLVGQGDALVHLAAPIAP
jgi:uncharacterized protein